MEKPNHTAADETTSKPSLAWRITRTSGNFVGGVLNGIPVVGHAKGLVHYACGDVSGGNAAMQSATRTTCVIAGGVGGALVGGPPGAVAGGVGAGIAVDGAYTGIQSAVAGAYQPYGVVENATNVFTADTKLEKATSAAQMTVTLVLDGVPGYQVGGEAFCIRALSTKVQVMETLDDGIDDALFQQADDAVLSGTARKRAGDKLGLVSLDAAVPVHSIDDMIATIPKMVRERARKFIVQQIKTNPNLTIQEAAAKLYTSVEIYPALQKALCSGNAGEVKPWHTVIKLLCEYVKENPLQEETICWRASKLSKQKIADMLHGKVFTSQNFGSTSKNKAVAKYFPHQHFLKIIFPKDCPLAADMASISVHQQEAEVLMLPGTQFEVLKNLTSDPKAAASEGADIVLRVLP